IRLVNLAPKGKIANLDADTIGGLIVNEALSIARSLEPQDRCDTLLVLDEFQRFINSDLEFALAEARQLKVQLVLSHQSFSQLEQSDGVERDSSHEQARCEGESTVRQEGKGEGGGRTDTSSHGTHEALQPIYEEFTQLASRNYVSFDEQKYEWGKKLRQLKTGQGLLQV